MPKRTTIRWVLAAASLGVGIVVVWRGLAGFGPGRAVSPVLVARSSGAEKAAGVGVIDDPFGIELDRTVTPDSLGSLAEECRSRVSEVLQTMPAATRPPELRVEPLCRVAGEMLREIAGGSFDEYESFVERHGGQLRPEPLTDEERRQFKTFHDSIAPAYALRPLSVKGMQVRARVLHGNNVPQSDFDSQTGMLYAASRYPALKGLAEPSDKGQVITGDTYEVLVPISYSYEGKTMTVLLGMWMTWVPSPGQWLPSRLMYYAPRSAHGAIVLPPY